ncbi:MAG TPA: DUF192 domain-containing protein [Dyella sp.]|nr:DUF192 domain-containing protein [Dyella sp.]
MKTGALYRAEKCLVPTVWVASNPWTRLRGLLGRTPLASGATEGLLIEPCAGVHTFGMRYPLDVVFLDASNRVVDMCENLAPWSVRSARAKARKTLELTAGGITVIAPVLGEELIWRLH